MAIGIKPVLDYDEHPDWAALVLRLDELWT
jgi:hypothetical protein